LRSVDDGLLKLVEIALIGSALILEARAQGGSARITNNIIKGKSSILIKHD
jgi:hypothetical protein